MNAAGHENACLPDCPAPPGIGIAECDQSRGPTRKPRRQLRLLASRRGLPRRNRGRYIDISPRCTLVGLDFVRSIRGWPAVRVLDCVANGVHRRRLRWVFNVAVNPASPVRELRFWRDELYHKVSSPTTLEAAVARILGRAGSFTRSELEIKWTMNATTISRLIRAGEIFEIQGRLTRSTLIAFLKRRVQ